MDGDWALYLSNVLHYELAGHQVLCGKEAKALGSGSPLSQNSPESVVLSTQSYKDRQHCKILICALHRNEKKGRHLLQLCILPL